MAFQIVGQTPEDNSYGMAYDGRHLILTGDCGHSLYFLNPANLRVQRSLETKVPILEDLAFWKNRGTIITSSFAGHPKDESDLLVSLDEIKLKLFEIDLQTGDILNVIEVPPDLENEEFSIIDGVEIVDNALYVTGKKSKYIYQFDLGAIIDRIHPLK